MNMILLNDYYLIMNEFSKDWNQPIYGREIAKKLRKNQKTIATKLKELEKIHILKSKQIGKTKQYSINNKIKTTTDTIIITEIIKKNNYLEKNETIRQIINDSKQITGIFGSQAKGTANKQSDIDIYVIGNKQENYEKKGKNYNKPISVKKFTIQEFKKMLQQKNPLAAEIAHNHINIHRTEEFIKMIAEDYYGYDQMV